MTVLYILSVCKAEEGSGVVPPLTDDNAADGKIGSAVSFASGWMEHWSVLMAEFDLKTLSSTAFTAIDLAVT